MRKSLMCLRLTAIGLVVGAMNVAWGGETVIQTLALQRGPFKSENSSRMRSVG
jgi:hypothetical protein